MRDRYLVLADGVSYWPEGTTPGAGPQPHHVVGEVVADLPPATAAAWMDEGVIELVKEEEG